ncbi:hybrid sensor histidine kinase/response regulator [Rapidithrix thailandica]|uniref:histidine kinase n=1 Tax=Rapidithrix thailandica TaxID=413964 RepID=A0AAW9S1D2_9BACT
MTNKPTILFIDDEQQNIIAFKANFKQEYRIYSAQSAKEGLEILKKHEIYVVLADQYMPGMTGIEMLECVASSYPEVGRMVVTGNSQNQDLLDAINRGQVARFILKPWKSEELKMTIDSAIEAYELKKKNKYLIQDLTKINSELEKKVEERTDELQQKNAQLIELNKEKNQLINIVAHDLKSPLSHIIGLIHIIQLTSHNLTPEQKNYIELIDQSTKRLSNMITQILDVNKLESKSVTVNLELTPLYPYLENVVQSYQSRASEKQIQLFLEVEDKSVKALIDPSLVEQIFENLLSNAVKFSPSGKQITVRLRASDGRCRVEVEDQGQGIKKEEQKYLFKKFRKLSSLPTAGEPSNGLGLSIVKKLVEEMKAEITCESELDKGATFTVDFQTVKNVQTTT